MDTIKNIYRIIRVLMIRTLAFFRAKQMKIPKSILILAPHPDDETFGCAGLIQRALNERKKVKVIILTGGEGAYSKDLISNTELIENRRILSLKATNHLGLDSKNIEFWGWKDGNIKSSYNIDELKQVINEYDPDAIFSPHLFEGWLDHTITTEFLIKLLKDLNKTKGIKLFQYCVWIWYSMPYTKLPKMGWKHSFILSMNPKECKNKIKAIAEYVAPLTSFGKSYSGVMPELFINANRWKNELYFELK